MNLLQTKNAKLALHCPGAGSLECLSPLAGFYRSEINQILWIPRMQTLRTHRRLKLQATKTGVQKSFQMASGNVRMRVEIEANASTLAARLAATILHELLRKAKAMVTIAAKAASCEIS